MTGHKTLKELQLCCIRDAEPEDEECNFAQEVVREEAIKWIKERISNCVYACRVGGIICKEHKFWMDRFNITKKDLK